MRFLLANNHCISDPTAGVTQSLRTIVEWLRDEGHECRVLTTARFEAPVGFTIQQHLATLGVDVPGERRRSGRDVPVVEYAVGGVPVSLLLTRHHDETRPHRDEAHAYGRVLVRLLDTFQPDQLIACNAHPMVTAAMAEARRRGITTAFAVRGFGYDRPADFAHVDHAFTCSRFLTDHYRTTVGLESSPLEPPIDWSTVVAPEEARAFVTFVHPAPHKGLRLFARLAVMLGARRPDIPVLVVQSGHSGGALNAIPGIDFSRYPQIMAAPAVATPAEFFALTRVLLVPSVWPEPFGRVAAEAMINGVPAIVSDRGSLPHVVGGDVAKGGGGLVRALPPWMTVDSTSVPGEDEVQPWFDAVCGLWDEPEFYALVASRARELAHLRYGEAAARRRHLDYFTSLQPRRTGVVAGLAHDGDRARRVPRSS